MIEVLKQQISLLLSHYLQVCSTVDMMFLLGNIVGFTSDWSGPWSLKKRKTFSSLDLSSCGFFYDQLGESLKFTEEFWRPATAGKVHHCSKYLLFLNSRFAGVQTLRKCLCYTFWLIGFNDRVSLLFLCFYSSQHHAHLEGNEHDAAGVLNKSEHVKILLSD